MYLLLWIKEFGSAGPWIAAGFLGFTTVLLLLWLLSLQHSYWSELGVPHVQPIPIFGTILENLQRPLHEVEMFRYKKYGTIYGYYEGNNPILSVADPKILKNIFVKDFPVFTGRRRFTTGDIILQRMLSVLNGEDWKTVRSIITPTFSTGKIKRMLHIFEESSLVLVQNLKEAAKKGKPIEVKRFYGAFTMDVIASSCFSTKIDSHNDPDNEFARIARDQSGGRNWKMVLFTIMPWLVKLLRIKVFASKGMSFFEETSMQIIEERKRTGQTRNDFLQLLLDTEKELSEEGKLDTSEKANDVAENYGREANPAIFQNKTSQKKLTSTDIVAQCVLFFLAGYDTTASTLSFTTYQLALHPDVQEKLIKEIDEALKQSNGKLTYEVIQGLKYLDNVISETLRLCPPGTRLERVAEEDYKLADTGIIVPKGMIITIPVYAIHRNTDAFPDPEKFDPDRWLPEERAKREQFTYLPFGAGPRNCVAMRFALMEAKDCLAHVFSNFRVKRCSKTKVPLVFTVNSPTLQSKEIDVIFEIREDKVTFP